MEITRNQRVFYGIYGHYMETGSILSMAIRTILTLFRWHKERVGKKESVPERYITKNVWLSLQTLGLNTTQISILLHEP